MRIVRYSLAGQTGSGVLVDDAIHSGPGGPFVAALADVTLLAPCDPRVIVGAGNNYGSNGPPRFFLKAANAVTGPGSAVHYPADLNRLEFEGELAVVIGKTAREVPEHSYRDYVLGCTCANDITADDWRADGQWFRAKSTDTFCPLGPWIETEVDDPAALRLRTRVNGKVVQDASTKELTAGIGELLAYITRWITLQPGDVVLTGTPAGVGPLARGDVVDVDIEGVGTLTNTIA
jgi:2-keto-4-pentenoate hydratase/2-oxohepta-3-ene-1,7-dioic acid hydratase in catechol pathway